nr:unnamed protein product [Digitaria exilis]
MASLTTTCLGGHASWCRFARALRQLHHLAVLAAAAAAAVLFLPGVHGAATAGDQKFPAIFMFGDSIVDPGNNNHRFTEAKANFPPYGQDFPGGVATGRFSNGLVPGDLLGIFKTHCLRLNATCCRWYNPVNSTILSVTTLSSTDQLQLFSDYKEKLIALVGDEEMTRVISQGVFFTVMGANDIINDYFSVPLRRHEYDLPSYVEFLVSSAINFTKVSRT